MTTARIWMLLAYLIVGWAVPAAALEEYRPVTLQDAAAANGNGTAIATAAYTSVTVQVLITNTATVNFEGTADGSNWVSAVGTSTASTSGTLVTSATSSGLYQFNVAGFAHFRARISNCSSCVVTVKGRLTTAMVKKGGGGGGSGAPTDATYLVTTADGTLSAEVAIGVTDDTTIIANGTTWQAKALPDCDDSAGNHLNYDTGTNAFSCGTSSSASGIGGTVGTTDNAVPRANGVGGSTLQASGVTIDDNNVLTTAEIRTSGAATGSVTVNGVTSGSFKITTADATAQAITVTGAAQTSGATTLTVPDMAGTNDTFLFAAKAATLTNKNYDAEGTGNVLTIPRRIWLPAAGCNNATAGSVWDLPTSSPAVAACVTGTNTQKGVLEFADSASLSAQVTYKLPSTWTGTVDANIKWVTTATTGNVVWQLATICVADAETDDPAFNTASTVTDAAKGTTLQTNDAAITTVTVTGCAAGELIHVKILRDAAHASDTLAATARLIGVELVIREAL